MKKIILLFIILILFSACTQIQIEKKEKPKKEIISSDIFSKYYKKAEQKIQKMSLEEKVGQLFLPRMEADSVEQELQYFSPAGYVLFARDFEGENKESMKEKILNLQEKSKIPLILAVDEEGGIVTRVSRFPAFRDSKFLSNQELYKEGGFPKVEESEQEKINLLKELGLNLNLAPVADYSTNSEDYIYERTFGQNIDLTCEYIRRVVRLSNQNDFATSLKHFPGYGNNQDTHTGIAIDNRSYDTFETQDYLPFTAGILEKVPTILVSHNIVTSIDPNFPASLSKKVHQELIKKLNFTGLIITDDLSMNAILNYTKTENSAVVAVLALNDLIITSNFKEDYIAVLKAVQEEKISLTSLEDRVKKILAFKYQYHIA